MGSPDISQTNFTGVQGSFSATFAPFSVTVMVLTPGNQAPLAPTGLTATSSNAAVALAWSPAAGATNYYVKRSTTSGSGYLYVGTNATPAFTDTGLANGTIYYYVVSGVDAAGEGSNSTETNAQPTSAAQPQLGFVAAGNQLQLNWPTDHTGWQLQSQTNSLAVGLGTNWVNVGGSAQTNLVAMPLNTTNGAVFFRLVRPY